jgi:antitoxin YefM
MITRSLRQAQSQLARLIAEVQEHGEKVMITRSGRPAGILISVEEYEGLVETLELLSDPELAKSVQQGLEDLRQGRLVGHEEVWDGLDGPLHD